MSFDQCWETRPIPGKPGAVAYCTRDEGRGHPGRHSFAALRRKPDSKQEKPE